MSMTQTAATITIEVTRTYLEMRDPSALRPAYSDDPRLILQPVEECPISFFRYLYREVGRAYHWVDRLEMTDAEIAEYLADPGVFIWLLSCAGAPAGYFELKRHSDNSVEIAYFGLLPEFLRRGYGKHLLTRATEEAWRLEPSRVWLHTCTLDDPAALPNYLKRGFVSTGEESYQIEG
jgi:GNAT superfamily N-acetyltransferase